MNELSEYTDERLMRELRYRAIFVDETKKEHELKIKVEEDGRAYFCVDGVSLAVLFPNRTINVFGVKDFKLTTYYKHSHAFPDLEIKD